LPLFEVAGIKLHSSEKSEIGFNCKHTALADQVKMLLLAGQSFGTPFGPSTYKERVSWVTASNPPNIVGLLARIVLQKHQQQQPTGGYPAVTPPTANRAKVDRDQGVAAQTPKGAIHLPPFSGQATTPALAPHSHLSPDLLDRIRVNREAALQRRMTSSPGPLVPTTPSPASQPETPPTRLVQRDPSDSMPSASTRQNTQKHTRIEDDRRAAETHKRVATMSPSGNVLGPPPAGQNPAKRQQNVQKLADAITRGLPASVFPADRCFKCAGKHKCDNCTEPQSSCIGSLLIRAQCCTKCAIPL
jgi:hypothetical protein